METFSFQFLNIFTFPTVRILHERLINMKTNRVSRGKELIKMGKPVARNGNTVYKYSSSAWSWT